MCFVRVWSGEYFEVQSLFPALHEVSHELIVMYHKWGEVHVVCGVKEGDPLDQHPVIQALACLALGFARDHVPCLAPGDGIRPRRCHLLDCPNRRKKIMQ